MLNKTKLMMVNIRGLESKKESLNEIIKEEDPTIVLLMEIMTEEKERIEIEGYKNVTVSKREDKWGGIMFAIKEELANLIQIKREERKEAEMLFIQLTCGRSQAMIGLIYTPQENTMTKEETDKMYKIIEEEVKKAKEQKQVVIIAGDMNCKIGENIKGNKKEISKGGRRMMKMAKNMEMKIMNGDEKCKGMWTRTQKDKNSTKKSVIDYVLITEEHQDIIKKMTIDEEKEKTPYRDDSKNRDKVYTDHNMIILEMDMEMKREPKGERIVINEANMEKFKEATNEGSLTKIWDERTNVQERYTKWNEEVIKIAQSVCKQRTKSQKENKETRIMRNKRKTLKEEMGKEKNKEKIEIIKRRRELIRDHLMGNKLKENKRRVLKIANEIKKEGIFNANAFWDFRRKMNKDKKIEGRSVNNKEGERQDQPETIKQVYKEYFEELLTVGEANTKEEKEIEEEIDKCIDIMREIAENGKIDEITEAEYAEMKASLKKRKAPDLQGWTYELVINAGKDLEKSIRKMKNTLIRHQIVPEQWEDMKIRTVDKGKGWLEMKEKRGLFMTNILSKCMEKILFKRREEELIEGLTQFQCGGVKGRGTQDNLFAVNHVINEYRKRKRNLYLLFADIEKCFDNLWLRECIVEMSRCDIPTEEVIYIYKMNEKVKAIIQTPVGMTEKIELEEIVKQGTVGGNKLCGKSTDRINNMGQYAQIVEGIKYPTFVDDTLSIGEVKTLEEMNAKMRTLEITKKYKYNNKKGKTEWMMMKLGKEKEENVNLEIKSGKIERTEKYKYLGDVYNEKGENESKIRAKGEKIESMARVIIAESSTKKIGKATLEARKILMKAITTPTLLTNTETWHNITKQEEKLITQQHHKILTRCLQIPRATPYLGILSEMDVTPFTDEIWIRKIMFFYTLVMSKEERNARVILMKQMKESNNWYTELQEYTTQQNININIEHIQEKQYDEYKDEVSQLVKEKNVKEIEKAKEEMKKLRFVKPGYEQPYLKECTIEEARMVMKVRLNMIETRMNYKRKGEETICRRCGIEDETTEHVLKCRGEEFTEERLEDVVWWRKVWTIYKMIDEEHKEGSRTNADDDDDEGTVIVSG